MKQKQGLFRSSRLFVLITLATAFLILPACVTERSAITGKKRAYGFSWNKEIELGRDADKQIVEEFGLYNDPKLQAYVQRIGQGVLAKSDFRDADAPEMYRNAPFTFRVLDSPVVNAFALPGGYVYVTRGLLTHLDNEAQLSVVLGHEIAHVAARHSARQALKAQAGQIGLLAGAVLGGQVLGDAQAAQQVAKLGGQAMQMLMLKYGRDDEREADQLGVKYAALKGYDVAESAKFFNSLKRIGEKEGARIPSWLSTHPDPGQREQTVLKLSEQYANPMAIKTDAEDEFLAQIQNVVLGENPREGFVQNNTFYHPEMGFQFAIPRGWKLKNDKSVVLLADPNQRAMMALELTPAKSAREAAQAFSSQQGLQVVQTRPVNLNGREAYQIVAQANTQQGQAALMSTFMEHNGRVFAFTGITSASALQTYDDVFSQVARGFRNVTDPKILGVQPARVQVVTTDRAGPFTSFLPTSEAPGLTAEDLAILNQVQLNQTIPAGTKIKVPSTSSGGARGTRQTQE